MNSRHAACAAACLVLAVAASAFAGPSRDGFEGANAGKAWRPKVGAWTVDGGRYVHTRSRTQAGSAYSVSSFPIGDGTIAATATATQGNAVNKGGCFGLMKYVDARNWYAVRYGSYGAVAVEVHENGRRRVIQTGYHFRPAAGKAYALRILIKGARLLICLDNRAIAVVENLPAFPQKGYAGLFALSACAFDDVSVSERPPRDEGHHRRADVATERDRRSGTRR